MQSAGDINIDNAQDLNMSNGNINNESAARDK